MNKSNKMFRYEPRRCHTNRGLGRGGSYFKNLIMIFLLCVTFQSVFADAINNITVYVPQFLTIPGMEGRSMMTLDIPSVNEPSVDIQVIDSIFYLTYGFTTTNMEWPDNVEFKLLDQKNNLYSDRVSNFVDKLLPSPVVELNVTQLKWEKDLVTGVRLLVPIFSCQPMSGCDEM